MTITYNAGVIPEQSKRMDEPNRMNRFSVAVHDSGICGVVDLWNKRVAPMTDMETAVEVAKKCEAGHSYFQQLCTASMDARWHAANEPFQS